MIENFTEKKNLTNDRNKGLLHGMDIAVSYHIYKSYIRLGGELVEQRSISCKRIRGGYENIKGYNNLN